MKPYEGAPMIIPIGYLVKPALPTNVPSSVTPSIFGEIEYGEKKRKGSYSVEYLVLAKGLVDFDPDDVVVDSIVRADGKNVTKMKSGKPAWKVERHFVGQQTIPMGYTTFELKCSGKVLGAAMPKITGKVSFTVAEKMVTKEFVGKISSGRIGEGGLVWKIKKGKSMWGGKEQLVVSPVGELKDGVTIEVLCGGKTLQSSGNMSAGGKVEMYFNIPATDEIVLKATYPEGTKKLTLPL